MSDRKASSLVNDYAIKISIIFVYFTLIFLPSVSIASEVADDIILSCTYKRETTNNYSLSKLSPLKITSIFYFDPIGGNIYNENKERIESSVNSRRIVFNQSLDGTTNAFNIDRQTGFVHLNKITTRDEMIKSNPSYNGGEYIETFEGECTQSNGARQF